MIAPERTREATIIQTRHRIPEQPLQEGQVLVHGEPILRPDPGEVAEAFEVPLDFDTTTLYRALRVQVHGALRMRIVQRVVRSMTAPAHTRGQHA